MRSLFSRPHVGSHLNTTWHRVRGVGHRQRCVITRCGEDSPGFRRDVLSGRRNDRRTHPELPRPSYHRSELCAQAAAGGGGAAAGGGGAAAPRETVAGRRTARTLNPLVRGRPGCGSRDGKWLWGVAKGKRAWRVHDV
jgi:hypothetical protein